MSDETRKTERALTVARKGLDLLEAVAARHVKADAQESLMESIADLRADLWRAEGRLTWYTTAPDAYDGGGTVGEPTPYVSGKGEAYRLVRVLPENETWQRGRYASGLHAPWTPEQFREMPAEWRREVAT